MSHELQEIQKVDEGFELLFKDKAAGEDVKVTCKNIVLATPADVTAKLLHTIVPQAQVLSSISYPPISGVVLAYPKDAFKAPLNGFGHLIPRSTGVRTLGTIYCSALFPVCIA